MTRACTFTESIFLYMFSQRNRCQYFVRIMSGRKRFAAIV